MSTQYDLEMILDEENCGRNICDKYTEYFFSDHSISFLPESKIMFRKENFEWVGGWVFQIVLQVGKTIGNDSTKHDSSLRKPQKQEDEVSQGWLSIKLRICLPAE